MREAYKSVSAHKSLVSTSLNPQHYANISLESQQYVFYQYHSAFFVIKEIILHIFKDPGLEFVSVIFQYLFLQMINTIENLINMCEKRDDW